MTTYRVRMLKRVSNDVGREAQVLQRAFEVEAASEVKALKAAKALYCALMRVSDCSIYADAFEVERLSWGDGERVGVISLADSLP